MRVGCLSDDQRGIGLDCDGMDWERRETIVGSTIEVERERSSQGVCDVMVEVGKTGEADGREEKTRQDGNVLSGRARLTGGLLRKASRVGGVE